MEASKPKHERLLGLVHHHEQGGFPINNDEQASQSHRHPH
jgi:hypothetical protein